MKTLGTAALSLAAACGAHAQTFSLLPAPVLGDEPFLLNAVNGAGTVVVGDTHRLPPASIYHSLRWEVGVTADRPAPLPGPVYDTASAISADGSVIAGVRGRSSTTDLDLWVRRPEGAYILTLPAGYTNAGQPKLSADGRIAVFSILTPGDPAHPPRPVLLDTQTRLITDLGPFPGYSSVGFGPMSADGSVLVGVAMTGGWFHAVRWTASTGLLDLGVLPGGDYSYAQAITADGSTIFGVADDGSSPSALFRWTLETGFTVFGHGNIDACSPDGRVLIGDFRLEDGGEVNVWDDVHGFRPMTGILQAAGLSPAFAGWQIYRVVSALNQGPAGYAFAGMAFRSGAGEAWWVATLPNLDGGCAHFLAPPASETRPLLGEVVTLTAAAGGDEPIDFQWLKDGSALTDDGHFSGALTPSLTIAGVQTADNGVYVLRATNHCGAVDSEEAMLQVRPPPCRGDFNHDGIVNTQDFFDFLTAFFNNQAGSDFNHDGVVNSQDFFEYINAFFTPC